jgi:hypothetical protein
LESRRVERGTTFGGNIGLAGKTLHLLVGSRVTSHIDFTKRDAVRLQVILGFDAPAAPLTRVKFHILHDFSLLLVRCTSGNESERRKFVDSFE